MIHVDYLTLKTYSDNKEPVVLWHNSLPPRYCSWFELESYEDNHIRFIEHYPNGSCLDQSWYTPIEVYLMSQKKVCELLRKSFGAYLQACVPNPLAKLVIEYCGENDFFPPSTWQAMNALEKGIENSYTQEKLARSSITQRTSAIAFTSLPTFILSHLRLCFRSKHLQHNNR